MADTTSKEKDSTCMPDLHVETTHEKEPLAIRNLDQSLLDYCLSQNSSVSVFCQDQPISGGKSASASYNKRSPLGPIRSSKALPFSGSCMPFMSSVQQISPLKSNSQGSDDTNGNTGSFVNKSVQELSIAGVSQNSEIPCDAQRSLTDGVISQNTTDTCTKGSFAPPPERAIPVSIPNREPLEGSVDKGVFVVNLKPVGDIPCLYKGSSVGQLKQNVSNINLVSTPRNEELSVETNKLNYSVAGCGECVPGSINSVIVPSVAVTVSPLNNIKVVKMQEQQQQHLKAMRGTSGQFAYYGLHIPQQQVGVLGTGDGLCPAKGTGNKSCIIPVRSAFLLPAQVSQPSTSLSSLINYLNVSSTSKNTLASSVSISTLPSSQNTVTSEVTTAGNSASNSASSNMINSVTDINVNNVVETGETCNNASSTVGSVSSSTSKTLEVKANESGLLKSPAPTSRMVTRSQTAAERMHSVSDVGDLMQVSQPKTRKRVRTSSSDHEEDYSPRKPKREMLSSSAGIGFDDFSYTKNPAGSGIEFGAVCAECGAVAVTGVGWDAHQQAHRGEDTTCIYCTQVFLTEHGRQAHQHLHREGQTRDVDDFCECGICGGSFISVMYLELHLLELHGRESLCNQRSLHLGPSANSELLCPPEDESGPQRFRCGVCQSVFTFSLNLDCHMALHSEVSYCCALCDVAFPTLDPLVNHSKAHRFAGYGSVPPGMQMHMTTSQVTQRPLLQPAKNPSLNMWKPHQVRANFQPPTVQQSNSVGYVGTAMNAQANNSVISHANCQSSTLASPASTSCTSSMSFPLTPPVTPSIVPAMAPIMSSSVTSPVNATIIPTMAPVMPQVTPIMTAPMTPAMLNYYMMMTMWGGDKSGSHQNIPVWQNYLNPAVANVFNYYNPYLLNNNLMNSTAPRGENRNSSQDKSSSGQDMRKENTDRESANSVGGKNEEVAVNNGNN